MTVPVSMVNVLWNPGRYFSAHRFRSWDVAVPLTIAIAVELWLSHMMYPLTIRAITASLPAGAEPRVVELVDALGPPGVGAVFEPVFQVAITATLAFLVLGAFTDEPRWRLLGSATAWAMLALTLRDVVRYGVVAAGEVTSPADLVPAVGLGFLAPQRLSYTHDVLELVNVFDGVYLYFLAFAISRGTRISISQGFLVAVVPWALLNAVRIGFNSLFY